MKFVAVLTLAIIATASCRSVSANDSAVETSAGGLKLRQEGRVCMEKERLTISKGLVKVEYEFRNTSPASVISEVAFPVPPMTYIFDDTGGKRDFNDFRIWVDGAPVSYKKEIRAFVKDREVTAALKEAGVTIETFADFDPDANGQLKQLKPEVRQKLHDLGALESSGDNGETMWPQWEAHLKYHWQQEFPPGKIVRIRHEYRPVLGGTPVQLPDFQQNFPQSCITPETSAAISRHVAKTMEAEPLSNNYFSAVWVDYILMTANSWQMPIKDFELVIETDNGDMATFCWDGDVERTSGGGYVARKKDFVPKKDLRVYFLSFW